MAYGNGFRVDLFSQQNVIFMCISKEKWESGKLILINNLFYGMFNSLAQSCTRSYDYRIIIRLII